MSNLHPKPFTPNPLLVIVGETASGKSALAMELARHFDGEIICADSWTVYKDFNIGTAKPTVDEQKQVIHHLIDIADPTVGFSAAEFKRLASRAIDEISAKGKLPILVGGSGLYIDSVLYDYGFLPAGPKEQRDALNELSIEALLKALRDQDIDISGIDTRNKRRLIRLLETGGARPTRQKLRSNTLVLGVSIPREQLDVRIINRIDSMFKQGLSYEVEKLAQQYGWDCEPMKGIGYREFKPYFEGTQTLDETREQIIKGTQNLAKKQRTWFKRNSSIQWVSDKGRIVEIVTTFLNKIQ